PLWDHLSAPAGSQVLWEVRGSGMNDERLVIDWNAFAYADGAVLAPLVNPITFQAVLYADGRIRSTYQDLDGSESEPGLGFADLVGEETGGISATVGLWNGVAEPITLPAGKFVPGPHSIDGAQLPFSVSGADTNDSYVRLAWDTNGAAWDIGILR